MRARALIALAVSSTLTASACGVGGGSGDEASDVTLTFTVWSQSEPLIEAYEEIGAEFAKEDPRVKEVKVEFVPFERYTDVLNVRLASGKVQDAGWFNEFVAPAFIKSGSLVDLRDSFDETAGYNADQIVDAALEPWAGPDGEIYGYPFAQSPMGLYWNEDMFAEAGLPTPDELIEQGEWTWPRVRELAKTFVDEGITDYGYAFQQADVWTPSEGWRDFSHIFSNYGAQPWTDDGKTCLMDSPEFAAAMELVYGMVFEDGTVAGPGAVSPNFWAGDVPMVTSHFDAAVAQSVEAGFEWGLAPQPAGPAGFPEDWRPHVATNGISAFSKGAHPEIAADLVAFMTSNENAEKLAAIHSTPREGMLTPDLFTARADVTAGEVQLAIVDAVEAGWRGPNHANWGPVYRESQLALDTGLWVPDADVDAALASACDSIAELLQG